MKEKFVEKEVKQLQVDKKITASSFTHLNSPKHKYPKQNDGYNCGVFVLWYHLFYLKEKGFIVDESSATLGNSDINLTSIRHYMLLYLFCLKAYFSKSEQIDENKSMIQNVIEFGKSECSDALNKILEDIYCRNIEKKGNQEGNDGKGNEGGKEGRKKRNKKNEHEEEKDLLYLTDSIKKFITTIVEKQDENKITYSISSLYVLLGQNIFQHNLTAFAHDYAEDVEVVFFELGLKRNTWVETQAYQLMFKENEISAEKSIEKIYLGII